MATRFEIALYGDDQVALRAAAEEALDEVQRIEAMLNWRQPASPVARVNALAGHEAVRVNPELFALVRRCHEYFVASAGAFDITIGPLVRAWEAQANTPAPVEESALREAHALCGMDLVELDEHLQTVRFKRPGMHLEFGAVGKGYALDLAAEILRDAGIDSALIHGGTSTVCAIGHPPGEDHWKIAVEYPPAEGAEPPPILAVLDLRDTAMSVSAVWGRVFRVGQDTYGHVLDPRLGLPAQRALLSIFITDSATESDAFSTALLTEGLPGAEHFEKICPGARTLVLAADPDPNHFQIAARGIGWRPRARGNSPVAPTAART